MDIQELAARARSFLESRTRPADPNSRREPGRFYTLKDRRPTWVKDLVYKAHADMGVDDFKYETIVDVLDRLADGQDPEEMDLEADVYNVDLFSWLSSNLERAGYVDEAVEQMGHADERSSNGGGIIGDIAQGQWWEKDEVWRLVVEALNERLEAIDQGEGETFEKHGKVPGPKDWDPRAPR